MIFPETVIVTEQEIDLSNMHEPEREVCIAEATRLYDEWKQGGGRRVVGIAGPSGAGKSVFVAIVKDLVAQIDPAARIIGLTIDAYHFRNADLKEKGLDHVKGRYDTYDVPALISDIIHFKQGDMVSFPSYSRKLHEPIAGAKSVDKDEPALLLVEGLWVLHGAHGWEKLLPLLNETLFLEASSQVLRERTIGRHVKGGRAQSDAEAFYNASDLVNSALVMATKKNAAKSIAI